MANVRRLEQLSVFLENRAGQMALLCSSLAEAGVNVLAISVADTIEHGLVRCVTDQTDAVCEAIISNGFNCLRTEVLVVELPSATGTLAEMSELLASEGVNLQYLYGSHLPADAGGLLVLRVLDLDHAEQILNSWTPSE